jgi:Thioredoxin-like
LPHLKASFAKYQNDPQVAFVLVSIDEDMKRLQRYLNEMKFPFTVVRLSSEDAQRVMGIDNTPSTFYIGSDGIVRYMVVGGEAHGDSPQRVSWYIDQLKTGK